jgi:hypothetical protein
MKRGGNHFAEKCTRCIPFSSGNFETLGIMTSEGGYFHEVEASEISVSS